MTWLRRRCACRRCHGCSCRSGPWRRRARRPARYHRSVSSCAGPGSGLSAVTRYSMGPPGHRPAQLQLANRGEHGRGREVSQRPRRPAGPRGGWVSAAIIRPAREAPQGTTNQPTGRPPMTAARCARVERERIPVPNESGDSPISAARIAAAGESGSSSRTRTSTADTRTATMPERRRLRASARAPASDGSAVSPSRSWPSPPRRARSPRRSGRSGRRRRND